MPVRQRGPSWQADVSAYGRRIRADFLSREHAEAWAEAAIKAVRAGRPVPPIPNRPPRTHRLSAFHGAAVEAGPPETVVSAAAARRLARALHSTRRALFGLMRPAVRGILASFMGTTAPALDKWDRETASRLVEVASTWASDGGPPANLPCPLCGGRDDGRPPLTYTPMGLRRHLRRDRGGCPVMRAVVGAYSDELQDHELRKYRAHPEHLEPIS